MRRYAAYISAISLLALLLPALGKAQSLAPAACQQFFSASGVPLAGGSLYSFIGGTSTPTPNYADSAATIPNPNPLILNAGGFPVSATGGCGIWLSNSVSYKFVVQNSTHTAQWTVDNIASNPASNLLSTANTWSMLQTFSAGISGTGTTGTLAAGPGILGANSAWTGLVNINSLTTGILDGSYNAGDCGSASVPSWCSGSEMGAWVNSAYAALSAAGGDIRVPAGNYSFTTPIVIGTSSKPAHIVGAPGGATTLTFTPTTGTAITFNYGAAHQWGAGLENIALAGPGAGTSTTALLLGGTNGAEGVVRRNLKITGFGTAETYGNNAFLTKCDHCVYIGNGAPTLSIPAGLTNSGESFSYVDSAIANPSAASGANCINVAATVNNLSFVGGSFDNCQYTQSAGQVHFVDVHFENPATTMTVPFVSVTGGRLSMINPDFQWDGTGAPTPSAAVACSAGGLNVEGASYFAGGVTLTSDLAISGTCEFHDTNMKFTSGFTGFYTNSSSGPVTTFGNPWGNNSILGSGNLVVQGAAPQIQVGPTGGNFYNIQANNPASSRTLAISDPGSNSHFVLLIASGTSTLSSSSISSGTCASTVTTTAANVTGSDVITWSYASFPNAATDGRLILSAYVSSGNVNFSLCNPTAGALVPSGLTINWSVFR